MRINLPTVHEAESAFALHQALGIATQTIALNKPLGGKNRTLLLKMESELPYGSYKVRGVSNALDVYSKRHKRNPLSLLTVSAGNMAQVVAAKAKELGVRAIAIVPDSAPHVKTDVIKALGAELCRKPMAEVWHLVENPHAEVDGLLIHPLITEGILAGYGVIALEIAALEEKPDAIFIPFGVGGLTLGVASIIRSILPQIRIICVELEAAPTLSLALRAGEPVYVQKSPSCADAIGTPRVVPAVLDLIKAQALIDEVVTASEVQIKSAMRDLYFSHGIRSEGAAAAGYAAALASQFERPIVIMTGRNVNGGVLEEILEGGE